MMTKRQKEMLDYLRAHIDDHGYAPTLEEIGRHFELGSLATVHKHLQNLQRKGHIRRLKNRSRALEVRPPGWDDTTPVAVNVPLLGRVAAGAPLDSTEVHEVVALPEDMLGHGETFALRVRGDSMIGDGIFDGDVVVVESRDVVRDGATVVALVRGEATVKKLFRDAGFIRLEPANERMAPIRAPAEDVQVRGEVIALMRRYR